MTEEENQTGWRYITETKSLTRLIDKLLDHPKEVQQQFGIDELIEVSDMSETIVRREKDKLLELGILEEMDKGGKKKVFYFDSNSDVIQRVYELEKAVAYELEPEDDERY